MMQQHRKAIAAGSGVLLIALLEYATTSADVERSLEAVVPSPWARLVPIVFGGLATVAAVWRASNSPTSDDADTVEPPAVSEPPALEPASAEAGGTILDLIRPPAPVPHRDPAPTSLVQLAPPPARVFQ